MANEKDNELVLWKHLQYFGNQLWERICNFFAPKVHKHSISDINNLQEQLEAIASTQGATDEKEVVSVETYSDLEELEEKSDGVVYITADDNKVYLYSEADNEFVEVTNEIVDNTIYVNNLNDLISRTYTAAGVYTVIHSYVVSRIVGRQRIRISKIDTYTLVVVASSNRSIISGAHYTPYLTSKNGWAEVVTDSNYDEVWQWHIYSYNAIEVTHSDLLDMCDNGTLVPGQQYRIIDYLTTVYDEEEETRSAEHPFDLLVTAATNSKLKAKAVPLHSSRDTTGYFNGYDLEKCEVWYDINNDSTKYKWADEENGKGVIWRMRDFDGNDCPYDFKNVQFKRYAIMDITSTSLTADALSNLQSTYCYDQNGGKCFATKDVYGNWVPQDSNGTSYEIDEDTFDWYYTFHGLKSEDGETIEEGYDMSTHGLILTDECLQYLEDDGCGADTQDYCKDNHIKAAHYEYFVDDEYYKGRQVLNNIVFINGLSYCYYNEDDEYWEYSTGYCYGNVFGVECKNNTFGNYCYRNTFGNGCSSNTFGNYFSWNTFGNDCYNNTFGNYCYRNTFGNYCYYNTFGNSCQYNTFGNSCQYNTFGNYFSWNTFGNGCSSNTFGNSCQYNTFGNDCYNNTFGNDCYNNTFGNGCSSNTFGNYVRYLTVFDGVQYVAVTGGSSSSSYVQNAQILNGTHGSNSNNRLQISFQAGANYCQFAGLNSSGILKIWVPADAV
ncbi:MAG: hypothetical protein IJQ95_01365 [Paludibacteraceae bacterium]|nr:hypothetical protein [Paludibacteraceae bacterium]